MVVVPECGSVLLQGIVTGAALAGDEPVFRIAIVFGWDARSVYVDNGAYIWNILAAAVERVIDGKEVLCRQVVYPLHLKRMTFARFNQRSQGGGAITPHTGGWYVTVDLGMNLTHGDT